MSEETLIRRATQQDAKGIHDAHMRSIRENCASDYTPEQIKAWSGREYNEQNRLKTINQDCVWVVEDSGMIQGFGHLMKKSNPLIAEVMGLYLTPEVKGKGLGKRILQLMEEWSKENGIQFLELGSTLTSFLFYKSQEFIESGPKSVMKIGNVDIPYIPMTKKIS